jgi:hypothetical protein
MLPCQHPDRRLRRQIYVDENEKRVKKIGGRKGV